MKTPRELLLEKHRRLESKLSQLDCKALAAYSRESARAKKLFHFSPSALLMNLWAEAVLPWRRVWVGLATVWLCLVAVNLFVHAQPSHALVEASRPDPQTRMVLLEQHRMLAQLLEPGTAASQTRPAVPGPRSDVRLQEIYA
jgi:hypothetical protein